MHNLPFENRSPPSPPGISCRSSGSHSQGPLSGLARVSPLSHWGYERLHCQSSVHLGGVFTCWELHSIVCRLPPEAPLETPITQTPTSHPLCCHFASSSRAQQDSELGVQTPELHFF